MKILRLIKKINNKLRAESMNFIKSSLPAFFDSFFDNNVIKELMDNNIEKPTKFNVSHWHLGYRYYTGIYNNKKVFIKINKKINWIKHEYEIFEYIKENSNNLYNRVPKIYKYVETPRYSYIIEEFVNYKRLKDIISTNKEVEKDKVYKEFIDIIKELHNIYLLHMDINDENVYIDDDNNIYLTDFGFSLISNNIQLDFIGDKKDEKYIFENLNNVSRLEEGFIDDAISFLKISKDIDKNFYTEYHDFWKEISKLSGIVYFDYNSYINNKERKSIN